MFADVLRHFVGYNALRPSAFVLQILEPAIRAGLHSQYLKQLDNGLIPSLAMPASELTTCSFESSQSRIQELPTFAMCLLRLLESEVVNAASSSFVSVLWSSAESGIAINLAEFKCAVLQWL